MNFICTVFEQGDEMLTLLYMEKQMVDWLLARNAMIPSGDNVMFNIEIMSEFNAKKYHIKRSHDKQNIILGITSY